MLNPISVSNSATGGGGDKERTLIDLDGNTEKLIGNQYLELRNSEEFTSEFVENID